MKLTRNITDDGRMLRSNLIMKTNDVGRLEAPSPCKPINRVAPRVLDRATPRAKRGVAKMSRARVGFKKIGIEITTRKPNTRLVLPHGQLSKESFLRTTLFDVSIHTGNTSKITSGQQNIVAQNPAANKQSIGDGWTKIISPNPQARGGPKKACQPADLRSLAVLACASGFTRCSCSRQTSTSYLCKSRRSKSFWVFKLPRFHEKKRMLRGPGLDASPRRHSWVQAIHATTAWTPYLQSLHKRFWQAAGFLRTLAPCELVPCSLQEHTAHDKPSCGRHWPPDYELSFWA